MTSQSKQQPPDPVSRVNHRAGIRKYGATVIGLQQQRAAHNEAFFRDVNERASHARSDTSRSIMPTGRQQRFVCECSDDRCMETLLVDIDEYRDVRAQSNRFILLAGHERGDIEQVVDRTNTYVVVEKLDG